MGQTQSNSTHDSAEKIRKPEMQSTDLLGPNGRYRVGRRLSEGQFGKVRVAFDTLKKKEVAIKFINRGPNLDVENVTKEIVNHRTLCHPHIIEFKEVFLTDRALCIVMEYAAGGDMHDFIRRHRCLPEDWARWFFQQIIIAIEYCHKRGVVLRDNKLENLLLDEKQQLVKVCDFGFSKHKQHDSAPRTCVGTPYYLPPEVLRALQQQQKPYDGEQVDVWTCGVCLYVMLYGKYPFDNPNDRSSDTKEYYARLWKGRVDFPATQKTKGIETPISEGCLNLLRRMLEPIPSARITLHGIKSDPWFLKKLPKGTIDYNKDVETIDENHIVSTRRLQSITDIEKLVREAAQIAH